MATPSAETPNPDIVAGRATTLRLYIRALGMLGQTSEWRPTCQRCASWPRRSRKSCGDKAICGDVAICASARAGSRARRRGRCAAFCCARGSPRRGRPQSDSETFFCLLFGGMAKDGRGCPSGTSKRSRWQCGTDIRDASGTCNATPNLCRLRVRVHAVQGARCTGVFGRSRRLRSVGCPL